MIVQKIQFVCKFFVCLCWILRCMQGDHPLEVSQFSQLEPTPVLPLCNNLCSKTLWWAPPPSKYGWRRNRGSCQASDSTFSPQDHLFYIFSNRTRCVHQKAVRGGWVEWAWRLFSERGQFLFSTVHSSTLPHSYGFHSSSVLLPIDGGSSALCVTAGSPTPPCLFPATSFLYLRACVLCLCLCIWVFVYLCICLFVYFLYLCIGLFAYLCFCIYIFVTAGRPTPPCPHPPCYFLRFQVVPPTHSQ